MADNQKKSHEEVDAVKKLCPEWEKECLDLGVNERRLIIIASVRFSTREEMAAALEITSRTLYTKILEHNLQDKI